MDEEEKKERKTPFALIIFGLLALLIGGLCAAHFIGLINIAPMVANVPYVNQIITDPTGSAMESTATPTPSPPPVNPLEIENRELRAKILELEKDLMDRTTYYEREKTETLRENTDLKAKVQELESYRSKTELQLASTNQIAEYLQGMKPDAIVKMMDNLDDNTVVQIFSMLTDSTVSKVLALMDPERAAVIARMLMG